MPLDGQFPVTDHKIVQGDADYAGFAERTAPGQECDFAIPDRPAWDDHNISLDNVMRNAHLEAIALDEERGEVRRLGLAGGGV